MNRQETEDLRAEIAQTRAELGETLQQLAGRADVKSRVQQSVRRAGRSPLPWVVLGTGVAAAVVLLILAGRRRL